MDLRNDRNTIGTFLNKQAGKLSKADDKQVVGIGGFNALVHTRQRITRTADVPTSPLENGSFANDHIILNPIKIEFEGWSMDIIARPSPVMEIFLSTNKTLGTVTKYASGWTQAQVQKMNSMATTLMDASRKIDSIINDGRNILDVFSPGESGVPNSQKFLQDMELLWINKEPFSVELEGVVYEDMFMVSWSTDFDNEATKGVKYSMTLQQLSFVDIAYSTASPAPNPAAALGGQTSKKVNKGVNEGTKKSLWSNLASMGGKK